MYIPPSERTLLMIPGPTVVSSEVLAAGSRPVLGHSDPYFLRTASESLKRLRSLFDAPTAQPVIVAGSGTLAMEMGLANLIEPGERVLILETGIFARRFQEIARRCGAESRIEAAPVGQPIDLDQVRRALAAYRPKVMTITHVDTSTGVRVDVAALSRLARECDALVVVDGVCTVGGEEFHGDAWGVDLALTASQKAVGGPPGLAMLSVGPRARAARQARKTIFPGLFTDLLNWLPVMEGYEGGQAAYFGTPAVTLIATLHAALEDAFAEGIENRVNRHRRVARAFKAGVKALGLADIATPDSSANTLTAVQFPSGIGEEIIDAVHEEGVTISRAIHPALHGRSFRVGHMGSCGPNEILVTLAAIERGLVRLGFELDFGTSLGAAQKVLARSPAPVPVGG
jgi:alanine-glyoxylate transaminase/serine-glyoxylate transaminase/serine-pyruvate transaminase